MTATRVEVVAIGRVDDTMGEAPPGHYYLKVLVPAAAKLKSWPATAEAPLGTVAIEVTQ